MAENLNYALDVSVTYTVSNKTSAHYKGLKNAIWREYIRERERVLHSSIIEVHSTIM